MFFFKRNKIVVDCFTTDPNVIKYSPIAKANEFIPEWMKKMPITVNSSLHSGQTIKACPGVIDLYKQGLMIPMWSDLHVEFKDKGAFEWQFSDRKTKAISHNNNQWTGFATDKSYGHLKLCSPWYIKTKENLSWHCAEPFWSNHLTNDYITIPGQLNFKYQHTTNINLFLPTSTRSFIIPHGHPMYHMMPLTDKQIDIRHHHISEEEMQKYEIPSITFKSIYLNAKNIMDKKEKSNGPFHWGNK